jgi:carbon storage regulator CsrA
MDAKQKGGLVLSRKVNEEIIVDGPATFKILASSRGRVSVHITAHPTTVILRGEILKGKPKNA